MVIGYALSFFKEAIVAYYFGVSSDVDAYTIAITIPVTLFAIVSVSIQSIVIPIYSDLLYNKGVDESRKYISNLITIVSIFSLGIIVLSELLASPLISIFAPGFSKEVHDLAVNLLRICMPTVLFAVLDRVFIGVLNVHKSFIFPSFGVYLLNIGLIVSIIALHSHFGITAACIGQVLGSILQIAFLIIVSRKYYHYSFVFDYKDESLKKSLKQSVPIIWSISIGEVCAITNRLVASMLFVGSIAALGYASKINTVMMQFFTAAISTIVYPLYAESSAKNELGKLNSRINSTLSVYSFFLIPLMCGLWCFRSEVVEIAFARGAFDKNAVDVTKDILGIYSIGLIFMSIRDVVTKVFYSVNDTKTPSINATIGMILNIVLNVTLPFIWGVNGLAIATTVTAIIISSRLIYQLSKKNEFIELTFFFKNLGKIILASLVMFVVVLVINKFLFFNNMILRLLVGTILGAIVYFVLVLMLKVPIMKNIIQMLFKKSKK